MNAQRAFQQESRPVAAAAIFLSLCMGAALAAQAGPDADIAKIEPLNAEIIKARTLVREAARSAMKAADEKWKAEVAALKTLVPDITESDEEFAARVRTLRADIMAKRAAELDAIQEDSLNRFEAQTKAKQKELDATANALRAKEWKLSGESLELAIGEFDRNAKTWPLVLTSKDPMLTMKPMKLVATLGEAPDPKKAILAMDAAVKAKTLSCELYWSVTPELEARRYSLEIRSVRVFDAKGGTTFLQVKPNKATAYFEAGKRAAQVPVYEIGDKGPAGGIVFWNKGAFSDGWQYLEAAPENACDRAVDWNGGMELDVRTQMELGTGEANSAAILAARGASGDHPYAAQVCDQYELNGFDDWFLPSWRQLEAIHMRLSEAGLIDMDPCFYWSSSQSEKASAWIFNFEVKTNTRIAGWWKNQDCAVRAVRAF